MLLKITFFMYGSEMTLQCSLLFCLLQHMGILFYFVSLFVLPPPLPSFHSACSFLLTNMFLVYFLCKQFFRQQKVSVTSKLE